MHNSTSLSHNGAVYVRIARFLGFSWLIREPRPSIDVETVLTDACHRIDQQDRQLKLQAIEIKHLERQLEWLNEVLKETGVQLHDYDYLHAKDYQAIRLQRRRRQAAARCHSQRTGSEH